jgi:cytochrome P450
LFGLSLSAIAVVSCCLLLLLISSRNNSNNKKSPPGRGSSMLWSVLETMSFLADNSSGRGFYHFVEARHRRYGPPCFRTSLFGRTHVFVSSPDAARALLAAADSVAFSKRYVRTVADLLGEHSLLCASHERHRSLRRALAPLFFNAQTTASLAASFDALTVQTISAWSLSSSSSVVVVLDAALGIAFEAICGMLVGTLLRHDNKERLRQMQSDVLAVTQAMLAFPLRMRGTRFHAGLQVVAYNITKLLRIHHISMIYIYIHINDK